MIISAPKYFTVNNVKEFLSKIEKTFYWKDRLVPDIKIDLRAINEIDIFGLLLIYKFIDFTYYNHCFKQPELILGTQINKVWARYDFDRLIKSYLSNKEVSENVFKELKIKLDDKFIIAPQALLRDTDYTNKYLTNEFIPKVEKYYTQGSKSVDLIFSCFTEVLLNFWEHAVEDTKSVIIADGTKNKIEIACADTGIGIIKNLSDFFKIEKNQEVLLLKALEKGMTTKPKTNHMGFGLWIVNELVKANSGKLHIYSQGYYYSNDFGKVKYGKTSYWPGTVIYLYLSLQNPQTVYDVLKDTISSNLKINFT